MLWHYINESFLRQSRLPRGVQLGGSSAWHSPAHHRAHSATWLALQEWQCHQHQPIRGFLTDSWPIRSLDANYEPFMWPIRGLKWHCPDQSGMELSLQREFPAPRSSSRRGYHYSGTGWGSQNYSTVFRNSHKRVILNVGGIRHEVMWKMLEQVQKLTLH